MRPFLIPRELAEEMTKLQDEVPPVEFSVIKPEIERYLGKEVGEVFREFEEVAVAAASIAQAHRAITLDGKMVAVKVQRPGIKEDIDADMSILADIAGLLQRHIPEIGRYDAVGIVEEIEKTTRKEMDFLNEARNIERFAINVESNPNIYTPKVYWDLTGAQILTLELIDGVKISNIDEIDRLGMDRKKIAQIGGRAVLKQIFEDGFFHADPHPGNLFVLSGDVIAPVDYGMMGYLDKETMRQLGNLLIAVIERDTQRTIRHLVDVGIVDEEADIDSLRIDLADFIDRYYGVPMSHMDMKAVVDDVFELVRKHKIGIQLNLMLLGKALGTYEEVARMLDPDFNFITEAKPFVNRLIFKRTSPGEIAVNLMGISRDYQEFIKVLPTRLDSITRKLERGNLTLEIQHREINKFITEMDRASNRLSFSLLIAALIVGSAYVLDKGPEFLGYSVIGILGLCFAGVLGIWLVIGILRSGRL